MITSGEGPIISCGGDIEPGIPPERWFEIGHPAIQLSVAGDTEGSTYTRTDLPSDVYSLKPTPTTPEMTAAFEKMRATQSSTEATDIN